MRRHYTSYFRNIPNIKPYRQQLVEFDTYEQVEQLLCEMEQEFMNAFVEA